MDLSKFTATIPSTSSSSTQTVDERVLDLAVKSSLTFKSKTLSTPYTVFVEGNVASGKTSFLNYFKKYKSLCEIHPEPVELWRNYNNVNFLVSYL